MKFFAIPALASALALAACGTPAEDTDATDGAYGEGTEETAAATTTGTIVDVASGNDDFSTLVTAVTAAGLADTLSSDGAFTVFAPTNDAFGKLPEGTLDTLTQEENKAKLVGILTYHVIPSKVDAATLVESINVNDGSYEMVTVNGGSLTATLDGENVVLTDAAGGKSMVTATDVEASNGVIHVIDTVVMPG